MEPPYQSYSETRKLRDMKKGAILFVSDYFFLTSDHIYETIFFMFKVSRKRLRSSFLNSLSRKRIKK
jgi:hypothetical protein